jgi:putative ABC transport system permease protein
MMNLNESFRIALNSLLINRMRAVLTTLGIIIGIASVISLVNLGRGVEDFVNAEFSDLGADVLTITSKVPDSDTRDEVAPLTVEEAEALANPAIAPNVSQVVQQYNVPGTLRSGPESVRVTVNGVTPNYTDVNEWTVVNGGSFITDEHMDDNARVVVLGRSTVESLFGDPDANAIGLPVEINDRVFTVIGVMQERDGNGFSDPNLVALIPVSTAQTRLDNARVQGGTYALSQIQVRATSSETVDAATAEIADYLREAHEIPFVGEEDFEISSAGDTLDTLDTITSVLTIFLGLIAGISLLVGGIGIMNIMLVSVSERTKEIGLRKAVGAQRGDILGQFMIESVVLSIIGGVLGILVGWLILTLSAVFIPDLTLSMGTDSVLLAVGVSTAIGVFFGLYPASRAAAMAPIDALRSE